MVSPLDSVGRHGRARGPSETPAGNSLAELLGLLLGILGILWKQYSTSKGDFALNIMKTNEKHGCGAPQNGRACVGSPRGWPGKLPEVALRRPNAHQKSGFGLCRSLCHPLGPPQRCPKQDQWTPKGSLSPRPCDPHGPRLTGQGDPLASL